MKRIFGTEIRLRGIILWILSVVFVGAILSPLITDTVLDWRRDYRKRKNIETKKKVLQHRHEEDLKAWEDSIRKYLDAKYVSKLKPLYKKVQDAETDGLGESGIVTALRMKINAVKNRKEAEFNELLRIKKREMKRQIEDLELK